MFEKDYDIGPLLAARHKMILVARDYHQRTRHAVKHANPNVTEHDIALILARVDKLLAYGLTFAQINALHNKSAKKHIAALDVAIRDCERAEQLKRDKV